MFIIFPWPIVQQMVRGNEYFNPFLNFPVTRAVYCLVPQNFTTFVSESTLNHDEANVNDFLDCIFFLFEYPFRPRWVEYRPKMKVTVYQPWKNSDCFQKIESLAICFRYNDKPRCEIFEPDHKLVRRFTLLVVKNTLKYFCYLFEWLHINE